MRYMQKLVCLGIVITVLTAGLLLPAGDAKAFSIGDLMTKVQDLMKQLDVLRQRLETGAAPALKAISTDVRYGMEGNETVRDLQRFLIDRGYLKSGLATGNFLTLTRDALRRFQYANNLTGTGALNEETKAVINGSIQEESVSTATTTVVVATTTAPLAVAAAPRPEHRLDPMPAYNTTAIERATFDAINLERQKNGLAALVWNDQIAAVARAHSADQARDNTVLTDPNVACLYPFIRHEGFLTGFKVGDRLEYAGIAYRLAGENIIILPMTENLVYQADQPEPACTQIADTEGAPGETIDAARARITEMLNKRIALVSAERTLHWVNREWIGQQEIADTSAADWMNSPGHRHNILTSEFSESGIGAAVVNGYIILTQVFLERP